MLLNELTDGVEIDQVLLVREAERRQRRDGGDYLRLQLGDRTGAVACMVWEALGEVEKLARAGTPVRVSGRYTVHPRFGPQINLRGLEAAAPGSFDPADLLDGPARSVEQMEGEIRELLGTIQEPHLRILLERVFGEDRELWAGYRTAPAAKYYHQAYTHGLLEHCLGVAQAVSAISATFGGIDRDVAVTGALLHDIGKLEAYTRDDEGGRDQIIDLTDAGRLHGEIALGYYRIRRLIEDVRRLPRGARAGGRAHHPLPSRLARARQPGRAVHARGDARAHDRQPRRATGELRPPREGALTGTALVAVRPGNRGGCVLRRAIVDRLGRRAGGGRGAGARTRSRLKLRK